MIINKLAEEFGLKLSIAENTVKLIDDGNTVPFIARYRKEVTGGMSDVTLRDLDERLTYLRNLEARKEEVVRLIEEQGKLTPELEAKIREADVLKRLEDLYKPFRQKRATRASKAREKGLEPLADMIRAMELEAGTALTAAESFVCRDEAMISEGKGAATAEEALAGAADIVAEYIGDHPDFNEVIREMTFTKGSLLSEAVDPSVSTVYDMYYEYEEPLCKIPNHRVLAVNRGEREKVLKVRVNAPAEGAYNWLREQMVCNEKSVFLETMEELIQDAYKRLMAPSVEREMRNRLTERAEKDAVKVFAGNTEKLLMTPPVKDARVIAIDPGYRTGCKVTMLDETGKLLAYTTIYPTKPKEDIAGARKVILALVKKYNANVVVIGNGTASRETETFICDMIRELGLDGLNYTIVSEAGASVYSASKLATEEYPDLDVTTRGAMSIGRRLQDPLAELVKIEPRHIGVGQYQHDVDQNMLNGALTNVVENCVNRVGVDLNTASPSLLSYIAGVNSAIAKNIVAYREANGRFQSRKELMKVPKLGEKAFSQCAGFLRIAGGKNPLDGTAVHPESYGAAEELLGKLGIPKEEIGRKGGLQIEDRIREMYGAGEGSASGSGRDNGGVGSVAGSGSGRGRNAGAGVGAKDGGAGSGRSGGNVGAGVGVKDGGAGSGRSGGSGRGSVKGLVALSALVEVPKQEVQKESPEEKKRALKKAMERLAGDLDVGLPTLEDMIGEMKKPARDPREDMPPVVFRQDVLAMEDLKVGMEMTGTVRNVVDFGAFVDIGVKQDGLVHISQIADKYIRHPMDVLSIGDTVKVRVLEVDLNKKKIGLTMKLK